jgi:hypothetical protein
MSATNSSKPVDDWELRCRFNTAHLAHLAEENHFLIDPEPLHPATSPGLPSGTLAQTVYYIHRTTQLTVARVHIHYFPAAQRVIAAHDTIVMLSGTLYVKSPDPKMVRLRDVVYCQRTGPSINRDPSQRWPRGSCERQTYIRLRRWACRELGPEFDAWVSSCGRVASFGVEVRCRWTTTTN